MNSRQLEQFCLSLPGTAQDVKWGNDLCYVVAEKMYCVTSLEEPFSVLLKVLKEEMDELTEREGIVPAPYLVRNHWIMIENARAFNGDEWRHYVKQSYELVVAKLPKKVRENLT